MNYQEFLNKTSFTYEQLLDFSYGRLLDNPPEQFDARLPAPPFLMVDRILAIEKNGSKGRIKAEQTILSDAWYFQCHFPDDPVQPGCLCVDAIWQLLGFYGVWRGALGAGRAIGCESIEFTGQIRPHNEVVRYEIDIIRFQHMKQNGSSLIMGDGRVLIDNEQVAAIKKARSGIFKGITYNQCRNSAMANYDFVGSY